ncbi:sporulation related protein [Hoeflea marina]|uniref:Sporulation related protein n=1 Tax=Hoeflea marina TaxID=274592 RepID=A0A317PU57_9HYPH|nr:SPOR domain-containing protein [Hoeflea marina]PWW04204.1 sporulation related protein [Hoeflea marina]
MSDDHSKNYRDAPGDIAEDDPLAELARIIGYDRPRDTRPQVDAPDTVPDLDIFDLEAELMRELDQTGFEQPRAAPLEAVRADPAVAAEADGARQAEDDAGEGDAVAAAYGLPGAGTLDAGPVEDIFGDEDFTPDVDDETRNVSEAFTQAEPRALDYPTPEDSADAWELTPGDAGFASEPDYGAWNDDDDAVDLDLNLDLDLDEALRALADAPPSGDALASGPEEDFTLEDIELDKADREKVAGFADRFYADDDDVLADMERVSLHRERSLDEADHGSARDVPTADPVQEPHGFTAAEDQGYDFPEAETSDAAAGAESDADYDFIDEVPSRPVDRADPDRDLDQPQVMENAFETADSAAELTTEEQFHGWQPDDRAADAVADAMAPDAPELKPAGFARETTSHYIDFEDELAAELDVYQQELDIADDDPSLTESYLGTGVPAESISIETAQDLEFAAAANEFVENADVPEAIAELDEAELDARFAAWSPATDGPARDRAPDDDLQALGADYVAENGFEFDLGPELEQALARSIEVSDREVPAGLAPELLSHEDEPDMGAGAAAAAPLSGADDATADELADLDMSDFDDLWSAAPDAEPSGLEPVGVEPDVADLDADDLNEDAWLEEETDENSSLEAEADLEEPQPEQVDRDEIADAFGDLLSEPDVESLPSGAADLPQAGERLIQTERGGETDLPAASAWLGVNVHERSAPTINGHDDETDATPAGEGGFDPAALSEADYRLEQIAEFDVPSIPHDDPTQETDAEDGFEADIEREFAQLVDAELPDSYEVSETEIAEMAASAAAWPGVAKASDEIIPDDYYDLEDNLESKPHGDYAEDDFSVRHGRDPAHDIYRPDPAEPLDDRGSRGPMLALLVLGIAVLGGLGVFGWSILSGDDADGSGGPRIILADKEPVKVVPENPGGLVVPNQEKAVYEKVDGGDVSKPTQPSLVTSAEEPVDVVQRTLDPSFLPLEGENDAEPEKAEDRLAADETQADGEPAAGSVVVVPRKVRTMVVRPDGTIVARDEPDPQPVAEAAPATATPPVQTAATEPQAGVVGPAAPAAASVEPASPAAAVPDTTVTAPVRVVTTQPITTPVAAPVPEVRPSEQAVNIVSTVSENGNVNAPAAAPAAPQAAAAPAVDNPGGYYMQIASQPTPEGAQASYSNLSGRFASVIGGRGVQIQRADIPGKGVYHRVRIPAGGRDEANALCARYKAAGGSCLVTR